MAMTRQRFLDLQQQRLKTSAASSKIGYRVVITPHFEIRADMTADERAYYQSLNKAFELDVVTDFSSNSSSDITTYPMVNGDTVADHMIRQAKTMSMRGTFSLYGSKPFTFPGADDRLTNIENFFEKLKNEGVMCTIAMIDRATNTATRFTIKDSMVLTNISFTYGQASMDYTFSWTEALTVNVAEIDANDIDYSDENSPAITDATSSDFTETLLDVTEVDKIVMNIMSLNNLVTEQFLTSLSTTAKFFVASAIASVAAGAAVITTIFAVCGSAAAFSSVMVPVGWIVTAASAAVAGIAAGIYAIVKSVKQRDAELKYKVQQFDYYEDDKKNKAECERFCNYIGNIHTQLEALNDYIQVYGIPTNENQQCMLFLDTKYYIFEFNKSNASTQARSIWSCNVTDQNNASIASCNDISAKAYKAVTDCTSSNKFFRTDTSFGLYVYFINKSLFSVENAVYDNEAARDAAINKCCSDLTNYCIMVTSLNMDEYLEKLKAVIEEAMTR